MGGYSLGDTSVKTTLKYGLNPSAKKKNKLAGARPLSGHIAAFAVGDEDEDDEPADATHKSRGNLEVLRQQAAAKRDQKTHELHSAALAEDPSIFDYDGHFDAFRDAREKKIEAADGERIERKARYITTLMAKQKEREREESIIYERRLLKEREKEDHLYGDKDKFVTAAYRAKLEEDAKWVKEEKLREAREARDDVTKKGGDFMSGFYHNLMTRNQAMGAEAVGAKDGRGAPEPEPPTPAEEAASREREQAEEEGRRRRMAVEEEKKVQKRREAEAEADEKRSTQDRIRGEGEGERGGGGTQDVRNEQAGREGGREGTRGVPYGQTVREGGREGTQGVHYGQTVREGGGGGVERGGLEVRKPPAATKNADKAAEAPEVPGSGPGAETNPHERRNKQDAVSAAKQRYLERKRKAAGN